MSRPLPGSALAPGDLVALAPDSADWLAFVRSRPEATAFHHPAWMRLIADCYGYERLVLAIAVDGELKAGLPLLAVRSPLARPRLISLPFTDHCPPLAEDAHWEGVLVAALVAWERAQRRPVEVRGELSPSDGVHRGVVGVRHVLPLAADPEALVLGFDRDVRSLLGKGPRSGLKVLVGASDRARDDFYRLHLATRRRLGVPIQPRRFFLGLWEGLLARDLGFTVLAYLEGRPVAGAVFLVWNGTMIYKYSASERDHWRLAPNHLVLWTAIQAACRAGCSTFDFGRTEPTNAGLRTFKSKWGPREIELVTSSIGVAPPTRGQGRGGRLLAGLIRKSPPAVCRTAGELFYRYFP